LVGGRSKDSEKARPARQTIPVGPWGASVPPNFN
jgi:hypothetical protein